MSSANSIACVILAAGQSKRMKSELPKAAHLLGGVALITHVLKAAGGLSPEKTLAVVSPRGDAVRELVGEEAVCVVQEEALGTGHALMQCRKLLADFTGDLLVLCGDVPLITTATLSRLLEARRRRDLAAVVLTARLPDPIGYGRIIHKSGGMVARIVEETDADPSQKAIDEVNSGNYCFASPGIWPVLEEIENNNRQGEYYLTDAIHLIVENGGEVGSVEAEDAREIWGINTRRELDRAEEYFQARRIG